MSGEHFKANAQRTPSGKMDGQPENGGPVGCERLGTGKVGVPRTRLILSAIDVCELMID